MRAEGDGDARKAATGRPQLREGVAEDLVLVLVLLISVFLGDGGEDPGVVGIFVGGVWGDEYGTWVDDKWWVVIRGGGGCHLFD